MQRCIKKEEMSETERGGWQGCWREEGGVMESARRFRLNYHSSSVSPPIYLQTWYGPPPTIKQPTGTLLVAHIWVQTNGPVQGGKALMAD